MTTKQPEALRLAEALDKTPDFQARAREAAAELRRLHDLLGKVYALCRIRAERIKELEQEPAPRRQPLTDEQVGEILNDPNIAEKHQGNWLVLPYAFARAVEQAHGITGEQK